MLGRSSTNAGITALPQFHNARGLTDSILLLCIGRVTGFLWLSTFTFLPTYRPPTASSTPSPDSQRLVAFSLQLVLTVGTAMTSKSGDHPSPLPPARPGWPRAPPAPLTSGRYSGWSCVLTVGVRDDEPLLFEVGPAPTPTPEIDPASPEIDAFCPAAPAHNPQASGARHKFCRYRPRIDVAFRLAIKHTPCLDSASKHAATIPPARCRGPSPSS